MADASVVDRKFEKFYPSVKVTIKLDPECVKIWPLGIEADLLVEVAGASFMATVPRWALNEDFTGVVAGQVGRIGNKIVITFPPTSLGTSIWRIPEDDIPKILAD